MTEANEALDTMDVTGDSLPLLDELCVLVPVLERPEETVSVFKQYHAALHNVAQKIEFIYVVSANQSTIIDELNTLSHDANNHLKVIILSKSFGEATAVNAGFDYTDAEHILLLPPYKQIEPDEIVKLIQGIGDFDLALGTRYPRVDTHKNQLQTRLFNGMLKKLSGQYYSDIGCAVRLVRRQVIDEVKMYGDQLRFLPLLAFQLGFRSKEIQLAQAKEEFKDRLYQPGIYIRRFLDLLTITFLTKFNKKPLRFFGLIGASSICLGIFGLLYLGIERLFFDVGLSDRPLLVLFSLFFVLGAQLISIGLIGETIIFTQSKEDKEYKIKEIIN